MTAISSPKFNPISVLSYWNFSMVKPSFLRRVCSTLAVNRASFRSWNSMDITRMFLRMSSGVWSKMGIFRTFTIKLQKVDAINRCSLHQFGECKRLHGCVTMLAFIQCVITDEWMVHTIPLKKFDISWNDRSLQCAKLQCFFAWHLSRCVEGCDSFFHPAQPSYFLDPGRSLKRQIAKNTQRGTNIHNQGILIKREVISIFSFFKIGFE